MRGKRAMVCLGLFLAMGLFCPGEADGMELGGTDASAANFAVESRAVGNDIGDAEGSIEENYFAEGRVSVSVVDYGADGADKAADDAAIQKALNAAAAAGGGKVTVPSGKYYLDKCLVIGSNTELALDDGAVMIRNNPSLLMLRNDMGDVTEGYGSAKNITVSGGTWNGNVPKNDGSVAQGLIRFRCAKNITVKDTTIKSVCGFHHLDLASVNGITVTNVKFSGFVYSDETDYGCLETGGANPNKPDMYPSVTSEALQMDYYNNSKYCCKNAEVSGCVFEDVLSGVGNHHSEGKTKNIVVTGNTFRNVANTCVNFYYFYDSEIADNKAENVRSFVLARGGSCKISGNRMTAYQGKNRYSMIRADYKAKVTVSENVIDGAGEDAIHVVGGASAAVAGNTVSKASDFGIYLYSATGEITGNTVKNAAAKDGICLESSSAGSIADNTVIKAGRIGICILGSTKVKEIEKNTIKNAVSRGIYLESARNAVAVTYNVITGCGDAAIQIQTGEGKLVTVENNTIAGTGSMVGIHVINGKVSIADNKISKVAYGITADEGVSGDVYANTFSSGVETRVWVAGKKVALRPSDIGSAVSYSAGTLTVKWGRLSGASGYELQSARNKDFTSTLKSTMIKKNKASCVVSGLESRRLYYVRVRGYKKIRNLKVYGDFGNAIWGRVK